jgi:ribosome-associated toxin RatA of RatAB toxin-antitoxin module
VNVTTQYESTGTDVPFISDDASCENLDADNVVIQVEKLSERQRQITASIKIPHPVEKVWQILTDYESLPEFIPNLAKSCLLPHPNGGIRLEQVGAQRVLNFNFCARVVLDLEEIFPQLIKFQMVEGDFKAFSGSWFLEPDLLQDNHSTSLCYTIQVWPKLTMPVAMIEKCIRKDLQLNLLAIRQRANELIC